MEVLKPDNRQTRFTQKRYNATSVIYDLLEWPVEQLWFKKWRIRLWNQVEGPKVLEIGVLPGKNISYYTEDFQVTAIDLSPGMLKRSKKKLARNNISFLKLKREIPHPIPYHEFSYFQRSCCPNAFHQIRLCVVPVWKEYTANFNLHVTINQTH